jgi:pimeloyl-ACP methyl ester carboxylesterase
MTLLTSILVAEAASSGPSTDRDTVVLLHGLGRTPRSMRGMARRLDREGYRTVNMGYPSREKPFEELLEMVRPRVMRVMDEEDGGTVHFVTHSLGGILVRACLRDRASDTLGRVVMLSPPNQGSEVVDHYRKNLLFRGAMGPAFLQLGTEPGSVPNRLGPVDYDVGVITGSRTVNPILSRAIPGEDDGKVSVTRAGVEGMRDFLVMPHSHTFIMTRRGVQDQVVHFLRNGEFDREEPPTSPHGAGHARPLPAGEGQGEGQTNAEMTL